MKKLPYCRVKRGRIWCESKVVYPLKEMELEIG